MIDLTNIENIEQTFNESMDYGTRVGMRDIIVEGEAIYREDMSKELMSAIEELQTKIVQRINGMLLDVDANTKFVEQRSNIGDLNKLVSEVCDTLKYFPKGTYFINEVMDISNSMGDIVNLKYATEQISVFENISNKITELENECSEDNTPSGTSKVYENFNVVEYDDNLNKLKEASTKYLNKQLGEIISLSRESNKEDSYDRKVASTIHSFKESFVKYKELIERLLDKHYIIIDLLSSINNVTYMLLRHIVSAFDLDTSRRVYSDVLDDVMSDPEYIQSRNVCREFLSREDSESSNARSKHLNIVNRLINKYIKHRTSAPTDDTIKVNTESLDW